MKRLMRPYQFHTYLAALALAAVLGLLILAGAVFADECEDIAGDFSSVLVQAGCTSPVGICTHGLLTGDLEATYDFTMLTLTAPDATGASYYTGTSVITTPDGSKIFSNDTGVIYPGLFPAPFVTTAHLTRGTGRFKKVDGGQIVASGQLNFNTGQAVGTYTGEICK
jgi:hypothetical protein